MTERERERNKEQGKSEQQGVSLSSCTLGHWEETCGDKGAGWGDIPPYQRNVQKEPPSQGRNMSTENKYK